MYDRKLATLNLESKPLSQLLNYEIFKMLYMHSMLIAIVILRKYNKLKKLERKTGEQILSVTPNITELFQHNLINVSYLTACYLYQVMMTLHFLNDVANDAESTQN